MKLRIQMFKKPCHKILLSAVISLAATNSQAQGGWLATSVNVTTVTNTSANGKSFAIVVTGGNGDKPCEDGQITFPLAYAGNGGNDTDIHTRAFSLAITALTTGNKISVHSYEDATNCNRAAYIALLGP
ncbi:DUF5992 family protein [Microbulbifer agarilyticus]